MVPSGGKIVVVLPEAYNEVAGTNLPCVPTYGFDGSDATCTINDDGNIELEDAFPTVDFLVIFTVELSNPSYSTTFFLEIYSFNPDGSMLEAGGRTTFKVMTEPGILSASVTNIGESDVVADYTDISVSFTARNPVDADGYFTFSMAKWNSGTQTVGLETSQMMYDPTMFQSERQGYNVPCTAFDSVNGSHDNIVCTFKVAAVTYVEDIGSARDILKIEGLANVIESGTDFSVLTSGNRFRNPPSTSVIKTYEASSHSQDNSKIDQKNIGITYKINTAATLASNEVTIRSATGEINMEQQFDFVINMPLPLPVGAVVKITVPPTVSIWSEGSSGNIILNSATGKGSIYAVPRVQVTDPINQVIEVSNLVPSSGYYVDANNPVWFVLNDMRNPESVQETLPFSMSIYEQDNIILEVNNEGLTYHAQPGRLENIEVFPENYKTRQQVPYVFSFETKNTLNMLGHMAVIIPPQITVEKTALQIEPISTVTFTDALSLDYNEETRELSILNAFEQNWPAPVKIQFVILDGLINADSTDPITPFIIQTHNENQEVIDEGYSEAIEFKANEISSIEVTACADKQTASETGDVCTYRVKFFIGSQFPIVSGSIIKIKLPEDLKIEMDDAEFTVANSYTDGIADLHSEFSVDDDNTMITVQGAFVQSSAPNGITWKQDSFSVYIAGITSPRSTEPTLSFQAFIQTSDGFVQYQKLQGVYANVYQARMFEKVIIQRSNEQNGEDAGVYNFTLELSSKVFKNEYIKITPPESIIINPGGDQCKGIRLLQDQLSCTLQDQSLYIRITPQDVEGVDFFAAGQLLAFQVENMANPVSMAPTDSFQIYVTTSLHQDYYVNQMVTGMSILNTEAGPMKNVQVLPDTNSLGTVTDWSIYFTIQNDLPQDSYIEIEFPEAYFTDLEDITCIAIKVASATSTCRVSDEASNIIQIDNGFIDGSVAQDTEIAFKLQNVRNPVTSVGEDIVANEFFIRTMSPPEPPLTHGYPIDSTYNLAFTIGCQFPCLTCDQEANKCTSCQAGLNVFESTCYVECPPGNYADDSNNCQACAATCERCDNSPDQCDSCVQTSASPWLVLDTGRCEQVCPAQTYQDYSSRRCEECVGNCDRCHSQDVCETCKPDFYYYSTTSGYAQCVEECPPTSIKYDSADTLACRECTTPCFTCDTTTETCTSCQEGFKLYETQCVEECPAGWMLGDDNTCFRANERTAPFITLLVPLFFLLLIACSTLKARNTRPITAFLALQSAFMVIFWIYQMAFYIKDNHNASASIVAFALVCNTIVNCMFYEFYKIKIDKNSDKLYGEYKRTYPNTQKSIMTWSMLTSFNLFRFQYCCFFDSGKYKARLSQRMKYYKRMNRYTLFQVTFVYAPTLFAGCYNLFYTWSGRQIYWIDLECILVSCILISLHVIIILRTQSEYILNMDTEAIGGSRKKLRIKEYLEDPVTNDLADAIHQSGYHIKDHQSRIKALNQEQRKGTLEALYDKMFSRKQRKVDAEGFRLKHGRGQDAINHVTVENENMNGEYAAQRKGFNTEKVTSKKMAYSSVQEHSRQAQESKGKGDYQQFNNDISNTMNDLGATQVLDDITPDTTPRPLLDQPVDSTVENYQLVGNDTTHQDLAMTSTVNNVGLELINDANQKNDNGGQATLRVRPGHKKSNTNSSGVPRYGSQHELNFDGVVEESQRIANDEELQQERELFNFASAPQNSKSALKGNKPLRERYEKLQEELRKKGIRQAELMHEGDLDALEKEATSANFKFSQPLTSSLTNKHGEDSDDILENFTSEQWGEGTTKTIANHYLTMQTAKMDQANRTKTDWKKKALENPEKRNFKLTTDDFMQIGDELKDSRLNKKQSKAAGAFIGLQRQELEVLVSAEKDEVEDLQKYMRQLEEKIQVELKRLQIAEEQRRNDLYFVENAFYTSNEEGMGVSPNTFEGQNRMPRPGNRSRTPERYVPMEDPRDSFVQGAMPQKRLISKERKFSNSKERKFSNSKEKKFSKTEQQSVAQKSLKGGQNYSVKSTTKGSLKQLKQSSDKMSSIKGAQEGSAWPTEMGHGGKLLSQNNPTETFDGTRNQSISGNIKESALQDHSKQPSVGDIMKFSEKEISDTLKMETSDITTQRQMQANQYENAFNLNSQSIDPSENAKSLSITGKASKSSKTAAASKALSDKQHLQQEEAPPVGYEYYTSEDETGSRIQKLKKKSTKKTKSNLMKKSKSPSNRFGIKKSPKNSKADLSRYLNSSDKNIVVNNDKNIVVSNDKNIVEQADEYIKEQSGVPPRGRTQTQSTGLPPRDTKNNAGAGTISPMPTNQLSAALGRGQRDPSPIQSAALQQLDGTQIVKSKKRTHKKQQQAIKDYGGAYFMHTNFERAVIATNGRAPYNNKEVEVITKPEGFNPDEFHFQNNWVNNLMNSGKKAKGGHRTNLTGQDQLNESSFLHGINSARKEGQVSLDQQQAQNHQHEPSLASATATTVFQGREPTRVDSVTGSVQPFGDAGTRHTPSVGQGSQFAYVVDGRVQASPISMTGANAPAGVHVQQHDARQTVSIETDTKQEGLAKSPSDTDFNQRESDGAVVEDISNNVPSQAAPEVLESAGNHPQPEAHKLHEQSPLKETPMLQQPISPLDHADAASGEASGQEQQEFHVQQFDETEQDTMGQQQPDQRKKTDGTDKQE